MCLSVSYSSTPPPSQSENQNQSSTQPKCRHATRLKDLTISRSANQRLLIQFDMSTGKVFGDNCVRFISFVALLGRSKVSILIDDWDHVPEELTYDVSNTILLSTKWISYVGQQWRCFKSDLTSRYIYGKEKSCTGHGEKKSPPHTDCLVGDIIGLEEIMIREASSSVTDDRSYLSLISPHPRHEKWKRARTKP
ncbi:hypothetical protein V8G54_018968 [Vigna mungo]|uniref:Uncharacterized protein n=1 Tax=Vigna mungo TaxID=3915 RepID=A0AAQ3N9M8_VIGMU